MVCQWGISERIGPLVFNRGMEHPFLGRKLATDNTCSEHMAWIIDQEIEKIVKNAEQQADRVVAGHREALDRLAEVLLEEEVLGGKRIDALLTEMGIEVVATLEPEERGKTPDAVPAEA
jgi:cell division protease FtsH